MVLSANSTPLQWLEMMYFGNALQNKKQKTSADSLEPLNNLSEINVPHIVLRNKEQVKEGCGFH